MMGSPVQRGDFRKPNVEREKGRMRLRQRSIPQAPMGVGAAVARTLSGLWGACCAGCAWTGTSLVW